MILRDCFLNFQPPYLFLAPSAVNVVVLFTRLFSWWVYSLLSGLFLLLPTSSLKPLLQILIGEPMNAMTTWWGRHPVVLLHIVLGFWVWRKRSLTQRKLDCTTKNSETKLLPTHKSNLLQGWAPQWSRLFSGSATQPGFQGCWLLSDEPQYFRKRKISSNWRVVVNAFISTELSSHS